MDAGDGTAAGRCGGRRPGRRPRWDRLPGAGDLRGRRALPKPRRAQSLAETLSGGTWTAATPPLPADAAATQTWNQQPGLGTTLAAVACQAVGSCGAFASYSAGNGALDGAIDTLSGGIWTAAKAPLPSGAATTKQQAWFNWAVCPAPGNCVAVGNYTTQDGSLLPAGRGWTFGSTWRGSRQALVHAAGADPLVAPGRAGVPVTWAGKEHAMKAIGQDVYGSPDVLHLMNAEPPSVGDREVLVRVHAAGVDPGVWHLMAGLPYLVRFMGMGLRAPRHRVPGMAFAGVVEMAGPGVSRLHAGDAVFGSTMGSFAELVCASEGKTAPKPARLTFEQAAAVPVSGMTALQAVRDKAGARAGQRLLVLGAGGGVGHFAVQIAKAYGAEVTGVCGTARAELVRSLGADNVIDRTREDFTTTGPYDVILDIAGIRPLSQLRRALSPRGTLVLIGGEGGNRWTGGFERQLVASLLSPLVSQQLRPLLAAESYQDLLTLTDLIETGKVIPAVDRIYPLPEAADAVRYVHSGQARGKVVITV